MTQVMVRTAQWGPPIPGNPYGWRKEAPWLTLIRKVNSIDPDTFGAPKIGQWWAGGTVEEYPDARVIFTGDDTVRVVTKTEKGERLLRQAAAALGMEVVETIDAATTEKEQ